MTENTLYILSGPLGVGKTSTAKKITELLADCVVVEGDTFFLALEDQESIDWEQRLQISLTAIVAVTKTYLHNGLNVVIDFAAEVDAEWFKHQLSDFSAKLKYVVLITNENTLKKRLSERNDSKYLNRSLTLLEKLISHAGNKKYLLDTTNKNTLETAKEIIANDAFWIK